MAGLRSMTGFGASSSEEAGSSVRVEVRSVNHRHLLVKTRLATELAFLEAELEKAVKRRLQRGAVTVHLHVERGAGAPRAALDVEVARAYRGELVRLARELGIGTEPSLDTLLSLPGVVRSADPVPDAGRSFQRRLLTLLDEALDALLEMREKEGRALAGELVRQTAAIEKLVARIAKRMPTVVRAHQRQLVERVRDLVDERMAEIGQADVAREIALLADRLDVTEELARLESHLEQLRSLLDGGGAVGRRLEFLVQEVFREVNTIGSKCSDARVAHWIVDAKTHVERLREQLQNVE